LAYARYELIGFQSWKENNCFSIELTFRDGAIILTEYDEYSKWVKVISLIEDDL